MSASPLLRAVPMPAHSPLEPAPFVDDRIALADSVICLAEHRFGAGNRDSATKGAEPPRGSPRLRRWVEDALIRLGGLAAITLSAVIFLWLYRAAQVAPGREGTLGEYLILAAGFLSGSLGAGLVVLGRHIHDRIALSERWRPRS